jgi:hypothetical protein
MVLVMEKVEDLPMVDLVDLVAVVDMVQDLNREDLEILHQQHRHKEILVEMVLVVMELLLLVAAAVVLVPLVDLHHWAQLLLALVVLGLKSQSQVLQLIIPEAEVVVDKMVV